MLKEHGDKISAEEKAKIEKAVESAKEALKGTDSAAMKAASEQLNTAWQTASAELYKAAEKAKGGPQGPAPGGGEGERANSGPRPGSGKKDDGPIIDAEVVDDKK